MKLTVLTDNNTYIDRYYLGEPAVAYYIEAEGQSFLFDTGYSDVYLKNAQAMGIDLAKVEAIILSHAHNDHTGGLVYFPQQEGRVRVVAHPEVFSPRRDGSLDIGSPYSLEEMRQRFQLSLSAAPVQLTSRLTYLGAIPRVNAFEDQAPVGERWTSTGWVPDHVPDDSALVYTREEGIYIITGCSHAGICNIMDYARRVTGKKKILGMVGGCHLFAGNSQQTRATAAFMAEAGIEKLYPCHCTSFAAKATINQSIAVREVGVGLELEW